MSNHPQTSPLSALGAALAPLATHVADEIADCQRLTYFETEVWRGNLWIHAGWDGTHVVAVSTAWIHEATA